MTSALSGRITLFGANPNMHDPHQNTLIPRPSSLRKLWKTRLSDFDPQFGQLNDGNTDGSLYAFR
ncbi:hypothetical protein GCM10029964_013190 [Kibdelosporangium lantanae]